jgi:DNA-directed RNA polymerase, subunit H, RpoH/RPB5
MDKTKCLKAVKTLTEYFILRSRYRRKEFTGFNDVNFSDGDLYLMLDTTQIIFVKKLGIKNYRHYCKTIQKRPLILLYETKTIVECNDPNIEFFSLDELQYNIFSNFMMAKIYCLTVEEENDLKSYYGCRLPILASSDKVSRYLGCKKGDIICFQREKSLYARIVE